MAGSRIARGRPVRVAAWCAFVRIVVVACVAEPVSAQQRATAPTGSWVDTYYADYTAMSAAPTGPAMDKWLAHYAPYAFFEDPTAGVSAIGHERIRAPYVEAFTGPLGPVRWTILSRATRGDWTAVEGWVDGTQKGRPMRARFTTWLKLRDGKIVHQIDYVDYSAFRGQVAAGATTRWETRGPRTVLRTPRRDAWRTLRVVDEFYRRYEAMPMLASPTGIARYVELLTEDFRLEDPTAQLTADSREKMRVSLMNALATGDYGPSHWDIERTVADGDWAAVEGTWRGVFKGHPFAARFSTWLQVRGDRVARQIEYVDHVTFRRLTSPPKAP
jgi:ketosteroid isomerase-like protein